MRLAMAFGLAALPILFAAPLAHAGAGPFDEVKLGLLAHDVPIGGDSREAGLDVNGEVLFVSPDLFAPLWAPRPHLGVTVNTDGKNSYAYGGLTWTTNLPASFFADLGLGGAIHDGPDVSAQEHHKGLGTRVLFHESVEFGYRLSEQHSIAAFLDHISNADLAKTNPGLTNLGLRLGIAF